MHRADVMKLSRFFRMSRTCLLCCRNDAHRIYADPTHKQGGREKRQEPKSYEVHCYPLMDATRFLLALHSARAGSEPIVPD